MENRSKKRRYYTFMVIPHDAGRAPLSLKIPVVWLYLTVFIVIFSALTVGSSFVYSTLLTRRLVNYAETIAHNRTQERIINSFTQDTERVNQAITEIIHEENQVRKLLGLDYWRSKVKLSVAGKLIETTEHIAHELGNADLKLTDRQASLKELKEWVSQIRNRYAYTPSCWPLYGRIVSRFGFRLYPWRGFHTGVDISGKYGAPVRATANGVVTFVGWAKGYGKTVMVRHGYGKSTLYAHCSRLAVKRGERVKKGQIISYVGNTGYTTGPHLHYEVRDGNRQVNPVSYLNLNILSASRTWRR